MPVSSPNCAMNLFGPTDVVTARARLCSILPASPHDAIPMLDRDIRAALAKSLRRADPSAAIFHELPLSRGKSRADVVSVNGVLAAYEIKSERDSFARLPLQTIEYGNVFEYMTIVVARRHLGRVRQHVPAGWGISSAESVNGKVIIRNIRKPQRNTRIDRFAMARLLWKQECIKVLRSCGVKTDRCDRVTSLWNALSSLPEKLLRDEVRKVLKLRKVFASDRQQIRCDDSCTTGSIGPHYPFEVSASYRENVDWLISSQSPSPQH
jgi:hypothetical protein